MVLGLSVVAVAVAGKEGRRIKGQGEDGIERAREARTGKVV